MMSLLSSPPGARIPGAVLLAAAVLSCGLILLAARGDLWLDELWSLLFAGNAKSPADVLLGFRHDNNHTLNTLYLYLLGEQGTLISYRLLSVFSGVGSVLLAGYAGREWGRFEACLSMLAVALAYPLLLYFSEARGYGPAIFLGLAAYVLVDSSLQRPGRATAIAFWLISVAGILFHATFIMLSLSLMLWSTAAALRARLGVGELLTRVAGYHALPLVFAACWYLFYLRGMEIGGGPVQSVWTVLGESFVLILGFPDSPVLRLAAAGAGLSVIFAVATDLARRGDMKWVFFLAMLLVVPTLVVLVQRPTYLYFRYFLITFPFFLLALAYLAGRCVRGGGHFGSVVVILLLALWIVGQSARDYRLLSQGRGQYSAALEFITSEATMAVTTVGSDHDFRNRLVFDFYAARTESDTVLRYIPQAEWESNPPEWVLLHSQEPGYAAPASLSINSRGDYAHVKSYRFSGVSGWGWFLYRRTPAKPASGG